MRITRRRTLLVYRRYEPTTVGKTGQALFYLAVALLGYLVGLAL